MISNASTKASPDSSQKALTEKISEVPKRPGVYIFKNHKDKVLYVGKAKVLRNRLRSYFQESANLEPRKIAMVRMIRDFSYIVTDNELEALILEANLIKQYKPNFNIILRDDKNYPYIKLTITEEWPRVEVVRGIKRDGDLYFGPYIPAQAMWEAIAFIRRNFPVRPCNYTLDKPMRPCIQHQMKKCPAPCAGLTTKEEYREIVEDVRLFLSGKKQELLETLEHKMQVLSDQLRYEEAAQVRDSIFRLQRAFESQKVLAPELGDLDVIGYYREGEDIAVNVLFVRNGILIGSRDFLVERSITSEGSEIMRSFLELFYAKEIIPPATVLVNALPDDLDELTAWLKEKRGGNVEITVPRREKKRELLRMAVENARLHFKARRKPSESEILEALRERLHLSKPPVSIGAFDVSTIQGSESVGAFIYWEKGEFRKHHYRHLKIKEVQGMDDYAMMKEIVKRTLSKIDEALPDLIIIDGGKGQLEVAREAMAEAGVLTDIIGVAKNPDRAVLLSGEFIDLEDGNKTSLLLKRIRDEVHRFAISFHRKLRDKRSLESPLTRIPGIGKKRRLDLLRHFGSIEEMRKSSVDEIMKIKGFNRKTAEKLLEELNKEQN
ncbi:MAG: excinuclease ABC subunit UvrC [Nitrospirota bacterium]